MPDNLYDNEDAAPEPSEQHSEEGEDKGQHNEDGSTFLVPKETCPDMKPGDVMTCKVNRVLDDQYEVQYLHEDKEEDDGNAGEEGEGESEAAPKGPPQSAYASMME